MSSQEKSRTVAPWAYSPDPLYFFLVASQGNVFVEPCEFPPEGLDVLHWRLPSELSYQGAHRICIAVQEDYRELKTESYLRQGANGKPVLDYTPKGAAAKKRLDEYFSIVCQNLPDWLKDPVVEASDLVASLGAAEITRRAFEFGDPSLLAIELRSEQAQIQTRILGDLEASINETISKGVSSVAV